MEQVRESWDPDLMLSIAGIFPSGNFDHLNPNRDGTDTTGVGSYQAYLNANFQKLWKLENGHFLRGRLSFSYTISSDVKLKGFSYYGGAADTDGTLDLGNDFSTILSFEYTLTQNWVTAVDFVYGSSAANAFRSNPGTAPEGTPADLSAPSGSQISIAPAIEYNSSEDVGIIVGVWFSLAGRNDDDFVSGVAAFNDYYY